MTCLLALGIASCTSNGLTLTEYATRLEDAVVVMNARLDEIDAGLAEAVSVDEAQGLWAERVAAREIFLAELGSIDPPESATEMHAAALDIMTRLTAAEAAMGKRAEDYDDVAALGAIWDTAEGRAARAVDLEAIKICQAAQAMLDETADREILAEVPWITSELKEVVDVAFGCTGAERSALP